MLTGAGLLLGSSDEPLVVIRHRHAQHEHAQDVKAADAQQRLPDRLRHILPRIRHLAECSADDLSAGVREASLHNARPEAQEPASRAVGEIRCEGAWVAPVAEADAVVRGRAAERDDQACQNEAQQHDDFDG